MLITSALPRFQNWGTKGQDKVSTDLGIVVPARGTDAQSADVDIIVAGSDLNAEYADGSEFGSCLQSFPADTQNARKRTRD